jgi:IS5 family transposase
MMPVADGDVSALLSQRQLLKKEGIIVDATIIAAPSSTRNARKERDPEMNQTKMASKKYVRAGWFQ